MPRRRGHSEEELPFVALMDTMTNVVGVLVIVLVMIGIGLAKSVRKVLSDLPPVTVEEHAKLLEEVAKSTPKDDPKTVEEETEKLKQELQKATESLATLDRTRDKQQIKPIDFEALQKQIDARKVERDARKAAAEKLLAEIDKLKLQLDTTPVYVPPPATVVKLPNPRPMPDKAELQRFLVAGGKIVYINEEEFSRLVEAELKKGEATMTTSREQVKGADGKPVMIKDKSGRMVPQRKIVYDPKKLADYFARLRMGTREVKVDVLPLPNSPRIPMRVTPVPGAGETVEQARSLVSTFQTLMKKFKADPKAVAWFYVYKDSIDTYLAARDLVDQAGVPAGWELTGNGYFTRTLPPEYLVEFTPPPPQPPPAPGAVVIAPPKTTLD